MIFLNNKPNKECYVKTIGVLNGAVVQSDWRSCIIVQVKETFVLQAGIEPSFAVRE